MSSEQALKELGLAEHQLRFTCRVHLHDSRKEQETALRVYSHLKRWVPAWPLWPWGQDAAPPGRWDLTMSLCSLLKDHCVQHLPDGSVTVESTLIQAAAHSEDPGTKVLLVSWTYQVCGRTQKGLYLAVGQDRWVTLSIWPPGWGGLGRMGQQPLVSCCRMKNWGATSRLCSRKACLRPPVEAADRSRLSCPSSAQLEGPGLPLYDSVCARPSLWVCSTQLATALNLGTSSVSHLPKRQFLVE